MKKYKLKLNLIDNYIAIYKILYNCRQILFYESNHYNIDTLEIQKICDHTLDLKTKYEKAFKELKMIDESFLNLKEQLIDCKNIFIKNFNVQNFQKLCSTLSSIENDYLQLNLF